MTHPLTPGQHRALDAYVEYENIAVTADELGLSYATVRNHLSAAYRRLDTTNILGAVKAMGWLRARR